MTIEALRARRKSLERRAGVRVRESRLTLALAALKLAACHGALVQSRQKMKGPGLEPGPCA